MYFIGVTHTNSKYYFYLFSYSIFRFWFLEYAVAGVVAGMFVFGTVLLCVGHISTDPTSRHIFHTTKRNLCAQGLNITVSRGHIFSFDILQ